MSSAPGFRQWRPTPCARISRPCGGSCPNLPAERLTRSLAIAPRRPSHPRLKDAAPLPPAPYELILRKLGTYPRVDAQVPQDQVIIDSGGLTDSALRCPARDGFHIV